MRLVALAAALILALAPFGARAAAFQRISGQRIALLASRAIAAFPHDEDHDFTAMSAVPDQIVNEDGAIALHADAPIGSGQFVNVPVEIDVDGRVDRTVMVGYRMQQYVETAVAARDLVPGTVLADGDLVMARVPYTGRPGNGIDALIGREVNQSFTRGQAVTLLDTTENQIVKAGSTVVLIIRDSGVAVTADVVARTSGGIGDQIFVYNPSTHKALSGTVMGPSTVELDISGGDQP
jgi:flagella basal body P-ring formation protein FlgA